MRLAGTIKHSMVNGPGIRFVVFFQGCTHHCPYCQNMDTWDPCGGEAVEPESLTMMIKNTKLLDGVTLSGGDPFMQPYDAAFIAKECHNMGLSVWCYTGYTYEQIIDGMAPEGAIELLKQTDVLVDGRFEIDLKSEDCLYRGSTNQRLIDVKETMANGHVCDWKLTD
ncbi:anaerobic ribonucleoside-triphosphate reductase activating protein [Butyrivibrio sp.]|uniref:anaerobic ribonucleoside-triphosphate reductase activating protein n=1 Tax=Butyrivibrio sp. TaxID=28121 RepID=UPI0025DC5159|nr:anaerobic ribonucleoside-triphosphate reductase activating protein [Butyrivibrio sp.]